MAEPVNPLKGITQMSTPNTENMSVDELMVAVNSGELNLEDVILTDEQNDEIESRATVTVTELHGALSVLFDDDPELGTDAVEIMLTSILGVIAEGRKMAAFFDAITSVVNFGEDDSFSLDDGYDGFEDGL
jgi:hypothetical protein